MEIKTCIVQSGLCNWDVDTTFNTVLSLNTDENRVGLSYCRNLKIVDLYLKSLFFFLIEGCSRLRCPCGYPRSRDVSFSNIAAAFQTSRLSAGISQIC